MNANNDNRIPSREKIDRSIVQHPNPNIKKTVPLRRAIAIKHNIRKTAERDNRTIPYWALKTDHKQVTEGQFIGHPDFPHTKFKRIEDKDGKRAWMKYRQRKNGTWIREIVNAELSVPKPDFYHR